MNLFVSIKGTLKRTKTGHINAKKAAHAGRRNKLNNPGRNRGCRSLSADRYDLDAFDGGLFESLLILYVASENCLFAVHFHGNAAGFQPQGVHVFFKIGSLAFRLLAAEESFADSLYK